MDHLQTCPFCGHAPDPENLQDSLHSSGIYGHYRDKQNPSHGVAFNRSPDGADYRGWEMNCLTTEGGCGAVVSGDGRAGALARWNTRAPVVCDAAQADLIRNESAAQQFWVELKELSQIDSHAAWVRVANVVGHSFIDNNLGFIDAMLKTFDLEQFPSKIAMAFLMAARPGRDLLKNWEGAVLRMREKEETTEAKGPKNE